MHEQVDLNTGLAGEIQLLDNLLVDAKTSLSH
jgi:hypothetical protein